MQAYHLFTERYTFFIQILCKSLLNLVKKPQKIGLTKYELRESGS